MRKKSGKNRSRKRKTSGKARKKVHVSTALVLVDQRPFLKKALSKCKRLRNELNKKQALLSEYEDQDRTAFQQWLNRTFGAKLSKMRELQEILDQYDFILFNLSNCSMFCPDKLPEMHKELFDRKKNGTLYQFVPPKPKDLFDEDEDDENDEWEDEEWDDDEWEDAIDEETAEAIFDEIFGSQEADFSGEDEYTFAMKHPQQRKSMRSSEEALLKKSYRALAKRLHPDHSSFDETLREKRWHETQEAYQNHDLEALLRVEAICDLDETDLSVNLGLARLTDLADYHHLHLKPIRHALSQAKRDIAFGFAKEGPTKAIRNEMKSEFEYQCRSLEFQIEDMQQSADAILERFWEEQKCWEVQEMMDAIPAGAFKTKSNSKKNRKKINDDPRQMDLF